MFTLMFISVMITAIVGIIAWYGSNDDPIDTK